MDKGIKLRFIIHNILYDIHKNNKTLDHISIQKIINQNSERDISFINNVLLTTMRYYFHSKKILISFTNKKQKINEELLLISSITQLVFLDFRNYAVIHSSVEIAKKINVYHGFINALLKKIYLNKKKLKKTNIFFSDLPKWFRDETGNLTNKEKKTFVENFFLKPSIHLVIKESHNLFEFEEDIIKTSKISCFLKENKKINLVSNYSKGVWWVQDFSSSLPLNNISNDALEGNCIDLCAAPGGKSFQILSKKRPIIVNDKSIKRMNVLKENIKRLQFNPQIYNEDLLNFEPDLKFDFIILDTPCSAVGTIRKNPEIFFKKNSPKIKNLIKIQQKMLEKASTMLNKNGLILYMVCSFLDIETFKQINIFLKNNKNFKINNFYLKKSNQEHKRFIKKNMLFTLPTKFKGHYIDGYFAVYLKKTS